MNLERELVENEIILSVFAKEYYSGLVVETVKNLKKRKICYVSLNKTSTSLQKSFSSRKMATENLFFIDAVSMGLGDTKNKDNVLLVSSPSALTELSIAITETIKTGAFDVIVFDSLSTLNIYSLGDLEKERFTSFVINKIKAEKKKGVFICLKEDMESKLVKNSFMCVDKVLRFNKIHENMKSKKSNMALAGLLGLVAAGSLFSGFLTGGNSLTGNVIGATGNETNMFMVFLFLVGAISTAGLVYIYRNVYLKHVSDAKLSQIQPEGKVTGKKKLKLKKQFKQKILSWLDKE